MTGRDIRRKWLLRAATTDDLRAVAEWIATPRDAEMWAGWRVSVPVDPDTLPGQIEFSETNAFCLVDDVRLVAFGQIVEKANRRGHLARVIVNPHDRRQGYGRILVERLIDVARARKLERVSLNVEATNAAAIALYALLGFRDTARPHAEPQAVGARYLERDV